MKKFLCSLFSILSFGVFASTDIVLTEENSVTFNDVVTGSSVSKVISKMQDLAKNEEQVIYLVLDTPGGSVFAGLDFINYLKKYPKQVHTITLFSASMGFQIVNGNPGTRYITSTGVLMSHPMSGGFYGEVGDKLDVENRMSMLKEITNTLDMEVVNRSNGKFTLQDYKSSYTNELWITGQYAVDKGYADEIAQITCGMNGSNEVYGRALGERYIIEYFVTYDKCPLASAPLKYKINLLIPTPFGIVALTVISSGYDNTVSDKVSTSKDISDSIKREAIESETRAIQKIVNRLTLSSKEKLDLLKKGQL